MFCPCLFVYLSVCLYIHTYIKKQDYLLLARLLKNACMDLDEMLRVDRCQDSGHGQTDLLFSPIRIIARMPEPDCFLRYRIGYRTLQPCLGCQRAALLRGILRRENAPYVYWRRATRASIGFKMVLLTEPSKDLCRR